MGCGSSKAVVDDAPPQIGFFDKYTLGGLLGKGAYGSVRLAHSVESNEEFAVKILDLHDGKTAATRSSKHHVREDAKAEQQTLTRVGVHPNVVTLRETFVDDRFGYVVMERCLMSLDAAWKAEPHLNEFTYARYFREMAQALVHVHSVGVIHRDVKHDNFMLGAPDGRTVKLCDFGLSALMQGKSTLSGRFGTAPYMAPEMASSYAHGPPSDVWSLGVIVYMAFFGSWPYQPAQNTASEMRRAIRRGTVPPTFAPPARYASQKVVSQVGIRFARALLDRSPLARPSAALCLEMDYLSNARYEQWQSTCEKKAREISLAPLLHPAARCGAFNAARPLRAEFRQEAELRRLQSTAQSNRETGIVGWTATGRSSGALGSGSTAFEGRSSKYEGFQGRRSRQSVATIRVGQGLDAHLHGFARDSAASGATRTKCDRQKFWP